MKIRHRLLALSLVVISLISLLTTTASAGWVPSYGGTGSFGEVGTGYWTTDMQGIRITILAPDGQPAFSYGETSTNLGIDLLYTDKYTGAINAMYGSCKAAEAINPLSIDDKEYIKGADGKTFGTKYLGEGNMEARAGIGYCILGFDWVVRFITNGDWEFLAPAQGTSNQIWSNFLKIKNTRPIDDNGSWVRNGAKIGKYLYGDTTATKPEDTAAIHAIFNLISVVGDNTPVWHLTDSGRNAIKAAVGDAVGETIANEYEKGKNVNPGEHVYRATELMELGNMAVVCEPIIWEELVNWGGQRSHIMLYGTPTNLADKIKEMHDNGSWPSQHWEEGGWDRSLVKTSRSCFVLSTDVEFAGVTYKVPWDVNEVSKEKYYILDERIRQKDLGWAMHIYICGSGDKTHTWDSNKYPESTPTTFKEHPAPDPKEDPLTKDKVEQLKEKLHYNIVKFYEQEILKDDGTSEIIHVATYERSENLSRSHGCDVLFFCPV